ncbi:hypothetical protein GOODEAATRI_000080 [Goodea atripinnis]|uniref:Uncharacterized protein n=1 Tax=Goodea atripinnis TaxID=208336 RepID=A0ABV0MR21_9TELE
MEVQFSLAHHILAMVKSERNRQIMCEGGLVSTLLTQCRSMLLSPNHHLHQPVMRIFEKLSSQAISHSEFRLDAVGLHQSRVLRKPIFLTCLSELLQISCHYLNFLLFKPDQSTTVDAQSSQKTLKRTFSLLQSTSLFGSAIPVHQIVSLVSMTAPRTFRPHRVSSSPAFVEFDMSESGYGMLVPGQWHHLAVVMAKDVKKSCMTSAYFNGKAVGTGKMKYIQPFPGQFVSMDPTAMIDVYGLIGTPALWKDHAALVWRVGPCHLFEEALSSEAVAVVYTQGTGYLGNFQALRNTSELVPEERISFGINTAISTLTTVVQIREDYNEVDCRLIAKEVKPCKMSEREDTFSTHPTRKPVLDFMRILLMDSLLNVSAGSNTHPVVLVLEVNSHPTPSVTVLFRKP